MKKIISVLLTVLSLNLSAQNGSTVPKFYQNPYGDSLRRGGKAQMVDTSFTYKTELTMSVDSLIAMLNSPDLFYPVTKQTSTNKYLVFYDTILLPDRPELDTAKVIMLVCNTAVKMIFADTLINAPNPLVLWQYGYSVREKHNTAEGVNDAGIDKCVDMQGNEIPCYVDYWKHLYYIDENKKPLPKNIIVWDVKIIN